MSRNRTMWVILTLVTGLTLAILGFALSAPIGRPDGPAVSDPRVEFAPLMFVAGVILLFTSAIVYEVYPDSENPESAGPGA